MSYINDALKKVQKEKDSLYRNYGNIISDPVYRRTGRGKRWMIAAGVIVLILLALPVFILLRYNAFSGTGNSSMAIIQDAGDKTEVGGQRSEVGGRKSELARRQSGEVGSQKAEVRDTPPVEVKKVPEIPAKTGDVKRLYSEALNYQRNGNPAIAEKIYRKILAIDPGFVMGLNNLGVICMSRKRNKEAADMFRKAIDLKADYVDPYYNLACLYSRSGNISKSLYYLKMAISINNNVKNWAKNDKDLEGLRVSETYKKIME
jgi:tetratricopeptide (TPR) repeat protein